MALKILRTISSSMSVGKRYKKKGLKEEGSEMDRHINRDFSCAKSEQSDV